MQKQAQPVELKNDDKILVQKAVKMIVKDYGDAIKRLANTQKAILFCRTTKNHLFPNGNKRTAVILTLLFLAINHHWLVMSSDDIYALSLKIAKSNTSEANVAYNIALEKIKQTIIEI